MHNFSPLFLCIMFNAMYSGLAVCFCAVHICLLSLIMPAFARFRACMRFYLSIYTFILPAWNARISQYNAISAFFPGLYCLLPGCLPSSLPALGLAFPSTAFPGHPGILSGHCVPCLCRALYGQRAALPGLSWAARAICRGCAAWSAIW